LNLTLAVSTKASTNPRNRDAQPGSPHGRWAIKPRSAGDFYVGPDGRRREGSVKIVGHRSRSCNRHRGADTHCGPVLRGPRLRSSLYSCALPPTVETAPASPSWKSVGVPSSSEPAVLSTPFQVRRCGCVALTRQKRSFRGGVIAALRPIAVSPAPTLVPTRLAVPWHRPKPNPAVDPVPFGHWTLRDKAAQRRSPPRWASQ
jgi:hypothetical protein